MKDPYDFDIDEIMVIDYDKNGWIGYFVEKEDEEEE